MTAGAGSVHSVEERAANELGRPRWRGQRGRLEVWYATWTGGWVHYEMVAPTAEAPPYAHGWLAHFPEHAPPVVERFGPSPLEPDGWSWLRTAEAAIGPGFMTGPGWDLAFSGTGPPLFTFPRAAWDRELLPGAQVVPWPRARLTGVVHGHSVDTTGAVSRIYGHGNAQHWCWLHADVGDDVLEVVAAAPRAPALRWLPPVVMAKLGRRRLIAPRARIERSSFHIGGRHISIAVDLPDDQCVTLQYADPDGATATCLNSERANASITIGERQWKLAGTAHAEIGTRP